MGGWEVGRGVAGWKDWEAGQAVAGWKAIC